MLWGAYQILYMFILKNIVLAIASKTPLVFT